MVEAAKMIFHELNVQHLLATGNLLTPANAENLFEHENTVKSLLEYLSFERFLLEASRLSFIFAYFRYIYHPLF
jgi:hypothetical protein